MQRKTVVIVEDSESQRLVLQSDLERRNFRVASAATPSEARKVVQNFGDEIDVMVLDMRLEDPSEPETTGSDIGIELQRSHGRCPPEYLIHSAFAEVNYYKLALRLGAAAYLSKAETTRRDVIRHVRALALKRALRLDRPQVEATLGLISTRTKSLPSAIQRFCREVLATELDTCLGVPYVLLLSDESGTQNCATNTDLPMGHKQVYASLQAMAQGISNLSTPYVVTEENFKHLPHLDFDESSIRMRLLNSAFIPLADIHDFRLLLGLLEPKSGEISYSEETVKLASVLAQYVKSTIVDHFVRMLINFDSQKRQMMLKSTSDLCLSLGEDQQAVIEHGIKVGQLEGGSETHNRLYAMSTDLWETGTILANVATSNANQVEVVPLEVREIVERAFADLEARGFLDGVNFAVEGNCPVHARPDDIYIAIVRILQWLAQRRTKTDPNTEPRIQVSCVRTSRTSEIVFQDTSLRLPKKLREQLFLPFLVSLAPPVTPNLTGPGLYLPLYLAKLLVEEKYGGSLEDGTDELEGNIGHRLRMRFNLHIHSLEE